MAVQLVPNLVIPDDVATTLGRPLTSAEYLQVTQWLDDTQLILARRFPDLTVLDQGLLAYVLREAVALKVKRPDPASQTTISIDDGSVSKTYEKDTGQITILPVWWELLTPGSGDIGAFTIRTRATWSCW